MKPNPLDPEIWEAMLSDYLRPQCPSFSSVYRRWKDIAEQRGSTFPAQSTLQRRLDEDLAKRAKPIRGFSDRAIASQSAALLFAMRRHHPDRCGA